MRENGYQVAGEVFTKKFYFIDSKLDQITLSLDKERGFKETLPLFRKINKALTQKYGRHKNHSIEKTGFLKEAKSEWYKNNGVNINTTVLGVEGDDSLLNINYQTRALENSSKL